MMVISRSRRRVSLCVITATMVLGIVYKLYSVYGEKPRGTTIVRYNATSNHSELSARGNFTSVTADYWQDRSDQTLQKANVEAILSKPWNLNKTAVEEVRREIFDFFNPYKIITMTSDDVISEYMRRIYKANSIPVLDVPHGLRHFLPTKQLFRGESYRTCSLVGNGGIILNSNCGEKIEKSDFVIRCNFASLEGYKNDVGSKTDILTFNPSIWDVKLQQLRNPEDKQKFLQQLKSYGNFVLWIPVFSSRRLSENIKGLLKFLDEHKADLRNIQLAFPADLLPAILDFWLAKGVDEERISTGLLMYMIASIICKEIHLFGFYPFSSFHGRPLPYHYDEEVGNDSNVSSFNSNFNRFHRLPDEFVYLKKLHDLGALNLHIGEC